MDLPHPHHPNDLLMIRSFRFGIWLACFVLCHSASAITLLPDFSQFPPLTDSIPPVISCPANITVQQDPGQCTKIVEYQVTATDDQPGVILARTAGLASGAAFPIGITVNSFIAVDGAGNNATCSFTVSVVGTNPSLSCNDATTVYLEANCSHTIPSMEVLNGTNCPSNYLVEIDRVPPFGNGPWETATVTGADLNKTYQVRVTNPFSGNRCWGTLTIKDVISPLVPCPTVNVLCVVNNFTPSYLADSLGISAGRPNFTDNCSTLTSTYIDTQISLPCDSIINSSLISRRWVVTDASGNSSTCIQKINVQRIGVNDVQFPADKVLSCIAPDLSIATNGVPFIAFAGRQWPAYPGSLCELAAAFTDSTEAQCGGSRLVHRIWQIINFCAPPNATLRTSVQKFDIQDTGKPVITCPPATNIRVNAANCQGKLLLPEVVITDGCSEVRKFGAEWPGGGQAIGFLNDWPGNNPLVRDTLGSLDSLNFPTGVTIIQYNATDGCGNTGTCSFTLFVTDTVPPTAICKPFLSVQLANDGTVSVDADSLNAGSSDACSAVFFKVRRELNNACQPNDHFYDTASFCCTDIGDTVTLRLRVYDAPPPLGAISLNFDSNYIQECTVQVRVIDSQPLYCLAPPDVTVTCDSFDATLTTYGHILARSCKADSLEILLNYTQFDTACRKGQIVRTFRVHDIAGNTADCVQHIMVQTFQDYYVRFPNDIILTNCSIADNYGKPQIYDLGCEKMQLTYEDQIFTVVADACYKIERTWKVINQCQYDPALALTIVPNPNPSIVNNAANLVGPTVSPSGTTGAWAPTIVRVNSTDPAMTNFSTFWSATSNGYQYTQIIKVIDGIAPIVDHCPAVAPVFPDSSDNDSLLWNASYYYDPLTQSHDLSEGHLCH